MWALRDGSTSAWCFYFPILGSEGILSWQGNWVSFTDTMLQISILQKPGRALQLPTRIRRIAINPLIHPVLEEDQTSIGKFVTNLLFFCVCVCVCGGGVGCVCVCLTVCCVV